MKLVVKLVVMLVVKLVVKLSGVQPGLAVAIVRALSVCVRIHYMRALILPNT